MTHPSTIDATEPATTPGPLRLGPLIRHIGHDDATIWVETDRPGCVSVRAGSRTVEGRTFQVAGHSYAILVVDGLPVGSNTPYEVLFDGEVVWPIAGSPYPPSLIRTIDPSRPLRLIFGSCRSPTAVKIDDPTGSGEDVLGAYARRIVGLEPDEWPDALLMLGDQVYADETSQATRAFIASRRDPEKPPYEQVADFEEYTQLYAEAWGDPDARWLLSVIPSSMIFDDHDVVDDWNTSRSWRRDMGATTWWRERITGALMSYWIYQHLGNLSATELHSNDLLAQVYEAGDAEALLRAFAVGADREADGGPGVMWSYRRDYGRVRLLMIDSRCGRVLQEGHRQMVSDREFAWIEAQTEDREFDHLLVGTSVPWLLPRALHDIEAADEQLTAGVRGRLIARLAEHVRRAVDLEHWAAFNDSFERLARLFGRIGKASPDGAPATICVLSGDVHHTYISETVYPDPTVTRIYQLTCSPMHNSIPLPMRLVFWLAWKRYASRLTRQVSRFGRVPAASIDWRTTAGPYFGNYLAMLRFDGRTATFGLEKSAFDGPVTRSTPVDHTRLDLTTAQPVKGDPAMTILSGLIAVFNRLLGSAATATVGWATIMLFGRVSQKQTLLSLIALGSLVWIVAVVAVVVPAIGGALITSVPRPGFVSIDWLRFALLVIAVLLPLGIGVATVTAADDEDRPKGIALVVQILRGYLITPVLGGTILFLAAVSVIRQARAMQKGWDDAHIPIIVKPGRYDSVAADIESALRESGLEITRKPAPKTLELPPRLLMFVGGGSAHREFPDELVEFDADQLNIILYPYDVLIVGSEASVGRARAAIARRLAFADAYLTTAEESEKVEDTLVGISRQGHVSAADFRPIDDILTRLAVPQGDWETLYRLRLQVEHETRLPGATGPADGS